MSMKIEILIRGLSLCYTDEEFWNVIFVCDDVHPLNFKSSIEGDLPSPPELHKMGKDREILFDIGKASVQAPAEGNAFDSIFNLAAGYAHGPDKLEVVRRRTTRDIVRMRIPSATLSAVELSKNKYFVQEAKLGAPVTIIDRVASCICAEFDLTNTSGLVMSISDDEERLDIRFPYDERQTLTLEFNNDCGTRCRENDFYHLYDWVRAKDGKEYVAGQITNSDVIVFSDPQKIENFVDVPLMMNPEYGNCDPSVIIPPPG